MCSVPGSHRFLGINIFHLTFCVLSVLGLLAPAAAPTREAKVPELGIELSATDLDWQACKAWVDGTPAEGDFKNGILSTLGLASGDPWSAIHYSKQQESRVIQYLVAFKRPLKFKSVLFQRHGTLKYLKQGVAVPGELSQTDHWVDVHFPPNQSGWQLATVAGESQAFLCTVQRKEHEWYRFTSLRLMRDRLHNIVPDGIANGDAEYTRKSQFSPPEIFKASRIITGAGRWQSHGPDQDGHVPRPPVSDIAPSWFVVSWDEPREMTGLLVAANFKKFHVYAYRGAPGINPAVVSEQQWERIKEEARPDGGGWRITFAPLTTRGLKFVAESTHAQRGGSEPWGAIDGLQVFTNLKDAAVPESRTARKEPPLSIKFTLPEKQIVSMAVDAPDGRRARNFPARLEMNAGDQTVGWDLKDDSGAFVSPGTYSWKAITSNNLHLKYEMTPYPNVSMVNKENSPWLNGHSGPGGWMADHTPPRAVCAAGSDRVFLSSQTAESGVAVIECDLDGRKLWGHHNLIAWTGPAFLASDGKNLYAMPQSQGHPALKGQVDFVWRFSLPEKKLDTPLELSGSAMRRRGASGLAVRDGKLYVAVNAGGDWLENAFPASDVDLDQSEPKYAKPPKTNKYDDPDRRADFLRLLRLNGTPPGNRGLTFLETAKDSAQRQHLVIALEREAPVGSFVFPLPEVKGLKMIISVLKPTASYPPDPNKEDQWTRIHQGAGKGWTVVAAPEKTTTRAIRLSFDQGLDEFDEALLGEKNAKNKDAWFAQLEGMKILRRRFENLFPSCKVTVNSGTVSPEGEWDARRDQPLSAENPGIFMMEWQTPQSIRGLAIKEIDGRFTDIEAWNGEGAPQMDAKAGWETLATYEQKLRYYYNPDQDHNSTARYMDGYVDFGREVTTRALRMRVKEQWMWRENGRAGVVGVRKDHGAQTLDPTRCKIYGVAPLRVLGGEPEVDILATQRIEVYDLNTKKLVKEFPFPKGSDLTFAPDGTLYGISNSQVVKIDALLGNLVPLPLDVQHPKALACNRAGEILVFDGAADQRVIRIFDPSGKPVRTIGTPGGRIVGPYDPYRFTSRPGVAVDLAVDAKDQLWVVECDYSPKRVSIWGMDGKFKRDLLGNTAYGGGGCLDPHDKSRLYYQGFEFALDWKTGNTSLEKVLWQGTTPPGEQPVQIGGHRYLVTRPQFNTQPVGIIYLHAKDRLQCVAAVGAAGGFPMLRTSGILQKLGRKALGNADFTWTDRNGDGSPQADEVEFFDAPDARGSHPGRFDETLGIDSPKYRYEVKEILPNGAPVYDRKEKAFSSRTVKMNDNRYFVVGDREHMAAVDARGKPFWTHPVEGWGVQAITAAKRPWFPGQAVAQFDVIGHETATAGDLGEFFVTNGNCGTWHIWTADGLLAGRMFRDLLGPEKRPWSLREHERGLDLSDATVGQEHFSGYFCKTREDGKFYAVAGHNHISVVEVQGLDGFKRLKGTITVTKEDVAAAMEWDRNQEARKLYESAKMIECPRQKRAIKLDGDPSEWDFTSATLEGSNASLAMSYDDTNLYLCFRVRGSGPLKNTGNDWRRLFKTGAAVDLNIGAHAKADTQRKAAVAGDTRVLMTLTGKEPSVVLYQPVAPGSKPGEAWETHTDVAHSKFDRVSKLTDAQVVAQTEKDAYCVEARIPLNSLGLNIDPDVCYKFDWGVLASGPDGNEVLQRVYWANSQTSILADEALESQLHPDLWGMLRFIPDAERRNSAKQDLDDLLDGKERPNRPKQDLDDLLDGPQKTGPKVQKK
jgi:hypothetical protein